MNASDDLLRTTASITVGNVASRITGFQRSSRLRGPMLRSTSKTEASAAGSGAWTGAGGAAFKFESRMATDGVPLR